MDEQHSSKKYSLVCVLVMVQLCREPALVKPIEYDSFMCSSNHSVPCLAYEEASAFIMFLHSFIKNISLSIKEKTKTKSMHIRGCI